MQAAICNPKMLAPPGLDTLKKPRLGVALKQRIKQKTSAGIICNAALGVKARKMSVYINSSLNFPHTKYGNRDGPTLATRHCQHLSFWDPTRQPPLSWVRRKGGSWPTRP